MLRKIILLIIFTAFCRAKISINLQTDSNANKVKVKLKGSDAKVVSDHEIERFNITKRNLFHGIRVEMGKEPDDVYLKDPTPYYDLFKKHKWPEVQRKLVAKDTRIVELIKEDAVVSTHSFINNSSDVIKRRMELLQTVEDSVEMIWRKEVPDDEVLFDVKVDFGNGMLSYEDKWKNNGLKAVKLPLVKSKGALNLKPGDNIVMSLSATKILLLLEIDFHAELIGNIVANYGNLYGKYHFYSPTVNNVMRAGKIKNNIVTKVLMEVRYYADPKLKIVDQETGKEIVSAKNRWKKLKLKFQ